MAKEIAIRFSAQRMVICATAAAIAASCGVGGRYGYDIKYRPLKKEKPYYQKIEDINYEAVRSDPLKYRGARLGWFGVVKDYSENPDGTVTLLLEYRTYKKRHLCEDNRVKSSCRVTVSERSLGTFTATFTPLPEDRKGKHRITYKSLVRVYGTPTGEYDGEGGPVLTCDFYRHWPAGTYVTTSAAQTMKQ